MEPQEVQSELIAAARNADEWGLGHEGDAFGPGADPGLYLGVPAEAYHSHPAISRSILAEAARKSPLHALYSWGAEEDDNSSDAMDLGTAAHAKVLEPERFEDRFDVAPDECSATLGSGDPCTYSAKYRHGGEWYCGTHAPDGEPDDVEVLKSSHYYTVEGMDAALREDPDAAPLLYGLPGVEEATILFEDPETGILCKARPDRIACLPNRHVALVDLKTTKSAHPQDFRRKYGRNGYWLQPAFYSAAVDSLGVDAQVRDFVFACVESQRPYAVQCYRPSPNDLSGARRRMGGLLDEMEDALDSPRGYADGVKELSLKRYQKDRLSISA